MKLLGENDTLMKMTTVPA